VGKRRLTIEPSTTTIATAIGVEAGDVAEEERTAVEEGEEEGGAPLEALGKVIMMLMAT